MTEERQDDSKGEKHADEVADLFKKGRDERKGLHLKPTLSFSILFCPAHPRSFTHTHTHTQIEQSKKERRRRKEKERDEERESEKDVH